MPKVKLERISLASEGDCPLCGSHECYPWGYGSPNGYIDACSRECAVEIYLCNLPDYQE